MREPKAATHEINSDRRNVRFSVGVICKSKKQAGLSYTGISNEEKLEQIVAIQEEEGTDNMEE